MTTEDSTNCKTANFVIKLMESKINTVNTRLDNVEKQLSTHCTLFESKFEELKEQRDSNNKLINDKFEELKRERNENNKLINAKLDQIITQNTNEELRINGLENWKHDKVEPSLKEIESLKQMKWKMLGIVSFLVFITPIVFNIINKLTK
jgi:hypothetical protein